MRNSILVLLLFLIAGIAWWARDLFPPAADLVDPRQGSTASEQRIESAPGNRLDPARGRAFGTASVAGRIVNQFGGAAPGIQLTLDRPVPLSGSLTSVADSSIAAIVATGPDGAFEFTGLCECRFRLQAEASARFAALSATVATNAGFQVLSVVESRRLRVNGVVRDAAGDAIEGVEVLPGGQPQAAVLTDRDGHFGLDLLVSDTVRDYAFRLLRDGYREAQLDLLHPVYVGRDELFVDAVMHPAEPATMRLSGVILDDYGAPVVGEAIKIQSREQAVQLEVRTDFAGGFSFDAVPPAADYLLSITPEGPLRDFSRSDLDLTVMREPLQISLERIVTGSISGRIVDSGGIGIAGVQLVLRSAGAHAKSVQVISNGSGYFRARDIPTGVLSFQSPSSGDDKPHFLLEGIELSAETEPDIELTLDVGSESLEGAVVDTLGNPVGGALLRLLQFQQVGNLRSQSSRIALSDPSGRFAFSELGAGSHELRISAAGFADVTSTVAAADQHFRAVLTKHDE